MIYVQEYLCRYALYFVGESIYRHRDPFKIFITLGHYYKKKIFIQNNLKFVSVEMAQTDQYQYYAKDLHVQSMKLYFK